VASHQLIDAHLATLAARLPSDAVDELADGLHETWHHYLDAGVASTDAARAAITEFGTAEQITDAFVRHAPGRRTTTCRHGADRHRHRRLRPLQRQGVRGGAAYVAGCRVAG
jgi:hypothetical protein